MAISGCLLPRIASASSSAFQCRSNPDYRSSPRLENAGYGRFSCQPNWAKQAMVSSGGPSPLIFRFPPNFMDQFTTKSRRNCRNIGVTQVVPASRSNNSSSAASAASGGGTPSPAAAIAGGEALAVDGLENGETLSEYLGASEASSFFSSDESLTVHAGEKLGRGIVTDSAHFWEKTAKLFHFKKKRKRCENPTTVAAEEKISALERAESTLIMASRMCASTVMLMALVPAGGHMVTTTDCYSNTKKFIETILPRIGITATVIDPADIEGLKSALEKNKVSLFFTESPTNLLSRCVDIKLVSDLCHSKGALVCIDGTYATPLNQKVLALGADLVLHSATKFIGGHSDVVAGCISGSLKLIAKIRDLHHVLGGALNPGDVNLIIRGMKTLHLRVQEQNSTAQRMAEILEAHPKVKRVYYPGLPSHPEHHIAKKQMTGFGGVVSFEIDGDCISTVKFVHALKIPYIGLSFGGCESIVSQPALMSYGDLKDVELAKYGITFNLVKFSFGVEDFEDLKADVLQALEEAI